MLADCVEALIGAIYNELGIVAAYDYLRKILRLEEIQHPQREERVSRSHQK